MIEKLNYLFVSLFGIGKITKIPGSIASLVTTFFFVFFISYNKYFTKYYSDWSYYNILDFTLFG